MSGFYNKSFANTPASVGYASAPPPGCPIQRAPWSLRPPQQRYPTKLTPRGFVLIPPSHYVPPPPPTLYVQNDAVSIIKELSPEPPASPLPSSYSVVNSNAIDPRLLTRKRVTLHKDMLPLLPQWEKQVSPLSTAVASTSSCTVSPVVIPPAYTSACTALLDPRRKRRSAVLAEPELKKDVVVKKEVKQEQHDLDG